MPRPIKQPTMTANQIMKELRPIFGDDVDLELWLSSPEPAFNNARPKDLLGTPGQVQITKWILEMKRELRLQ
jgi:uncharacterized protein (DUF2384 family)